MLDPIDDDESSVLLTVVVLVRVEELLGSVDGVVARVVKVTGISGSEGTKLGIVVALTGADMNSVTEVA